MRHILLIQDEHLQGTSYLKSKAMWEVDEYQTVKLTLIKEQITWNLNIEESQSSQVYHWQVEFSLYGQLYH